MRAPPPARVWSRSAGTWLGIQKFLLALSAAVAAYWSGAHLAAAGPALVLGSLMFGWGVAAFAGRWLAEPPAMLSWDGAVWSVGREGASQRPGRPQVMLDLGDWVLVRFVFDPEDGLHRHRVRWLPLSRRDAGAAWPALRVALHHDRAPAGPGRPLRADLSA